MNNIIRNVSKKKLNYKVPLVFLAIIIVAILAFVFLFQHLRIHNNKYTFSLNNSQCYVSQDMTYMLGRANEIYVFVADRDIINLKIAATEENVVVFESIRDSSIKLYFVAIDDNVIYNDYYNIYLYK